MRAPEFWQQEGIGSSLLTPISKLYSIGARIWYRRHRPWQAPIPVICIGNVTIGGGGKTPLAMSIGARLSARGHAIHFLTRGYRGRLTGPVLVEKELHTAFDVGDEPLLLAEVAPTWVARDRAASAKAAIKAGAEILVMDDGLQNPTLAKSCSFLVVDGGYGFGNGKTIPAGPLRESLSDVLKRTEDVVIVEPDDFGLEEFFQGKVKISKVAFKASPKVVESMRGSRVVAFAGIARPTKFFQTLDQIDCDVVRTFEFTDHHFYSVDEVMQIVETANRLKAKPVTTTKDSTRLPSMAKMMVHVFPIEVVWQDNNDLDSLLDRALELS